MTKSIFKKLIFKKPIFERTAEEKAEQERLSRPRTKAVVAVHGIGEQIAHETIQSVAYRFCHFFDVPPAIPLGRFSGGLNPSLPGVTISPFVVRQSPPDPDLPRHLSFAEVYWADVPRQLAENKYVLEESKKWAKTIAARVGVRAARKDIASPIANYETIQTVLTEMIDTVYVLEFLTGWCRRLGLFDFDLRALLVNFLGDVQVVTEFSGERERIRQKFSDIMDVASKSADEVYVVAHSEGTVVALFGLLTELAKAQPASWAAKVRGLMTIGSPIEVHVLLWPEELWERIPHARDTLELPSPIRWVNYLDTGDPIAYHLDETYKWLKRSGWAPHFDWTQHEFGRYAFPGKAHTDYWDDAEVFGHFIQTVVGEQPKRSTGKAPDYTKPPASKRLPQAASYLLPYAVLAAVLTVGVYAVYRPVFDVVTKSAETPIVCDAFSAWSWTWWKPTTDPSSATIARDVVGFALLLAGVTVAVRLPRLTGIWWLRFVGFAAFVAGAAGYTAITTGRTLCATGWAIGRTLPAIAGAVTAPWELGVLSFSGLGLLVVLLCGFWSAKAPHWGVRSLPLLGGSATILMVASLIYEANPRANVWPVVVGSAGFLYLWWLFALLFDLVFVWHRYVRFGAAVRALPTPTIPGGTATPGGTAIDPSGGEGSPAMRLPEAMPSA
jgi:hypothetical protein